MDVAIRVIAGLGNPGRKYEGTRHNIGFVVVDELKSRLDSEPGAYGGMQWVRKDWGVQKEGALLSEADLAGKRVLLIKPLEYMNRSGEVIGRLLHFLKIPPQELLVVHDDIDLPLGAVRVKFGGGEAGHKGLLSISSCVGTKDYYRVRVGVGRPQGDMSEDAVVNWVLGHFEREEAEIIHTSVLQSVDAIREVAANGIKGG